MLASTIRFSNHYQTPHTTQQLFGCCIVSGLVLLVETTPNTGFVIPGPNNVPVLAHRITRVVKAHTLTALVG